MSPDSPPSRRRVLLKALVYMSIAGVLAIGAFAFTQRRLLTTLAENWDVLSAGSEWAASAESTDAFVKYLAAHPERFSIATWPVGAPDKGWFHGADTPRSLASTVKILVLAEYATQVADGRIDPTEKIPVASWEALHLPGMDGGAHEKALNELREENLIVDEQVPLSAIARAMIVRSDNAATDLLMHRVGRAALERLPERLGLTGQETPWPLNGAFLVAMSPPAGQTPGAWIPDVDARGRSFLRDEAWRLSQRMADDAAFSGEWKARLEKDGLILDLRAQRDFARRLVTRGTARGYAQLMEQVLRPPPAGSGWAKVMSELLEWPLEKGPTLRERFDRLGTKGGSLVGLLTSAWYAQTRAGDGRVLAIFHDDMPVPLWAQLVQNFTHQEVERRALEEPGFANELRRRIEAGPTTDKGAP